RGRQQAPRPRLAAAAAGPAPGGPHGGAAMSEADGPERASFEGLVGRVVDEFSERLGRGGRPDVEEYAGRYPEIAAVLRDVLAALLMMRSPGPKLPAAGAVAEPSGPPSFPGYDLLGVLGRGGMGVVYQARQQGIDRLVALKVILSGPHAA